MSYVNCQYENIVNSKSPLCSILANGMVFTPSHHVLVDGADTFLEVGVGDAHGDVDLAGTLGDGLDVDAVLAEDGENGARDTRIGDHIAADHGDQSEVVVDVDGNHVGQFGNLGEDVVGDLLGVLRLHDDIEGVDGGGDVLDGHGEAIEDL